MLRLNPAVEISTPAPGRIYVRTPSTEFVISDRLGVIASFIAELSLGKGGAEAFATLSPGMRSEARERILAMLLSKKVVLETVEPRTDVKDPILLWMAHMALEPSCLSGVAVEGDGLLATAVTSSLEDAGVPICGSLSPDAPEPDLVVACFDWNDEAGMRAINRKAVLSGLALLLSHVDRGIGSVGPQVLPGATACYECCFHRVRSGRKSLEHRPSLGADAEVSRAVVRLTAAHVVANVLRHLAGCAYDLHVAGITRHDLVSGRTGHSVVMKVPRCPVCGEANMRVPLAPVHAATMPAERAA